MSTGIQFDNSYARELEGFYVSHRADLIESPSLLLFNDELASQLGLSVDELDQDARARLCAGTEVPPGAEPLAQVYAGHQFGGFSPQLGDGRALLLGEVVDSNGDRWDLQLKGSGPTPFSRGGDGKAPLGPVLREYVMAEAMHALGVPTTRALAAVGTNTFVYREEPLPGAVLTRVAASHVRIGTFQYFAARGDTERVELLANYVIDRHYPELQADEQPYLRLLETVGRRQAELVAQWMSIGFIHGVMNTDNMAISGETIDYGPCAFMDQYDPKTVFSSIDRAGRYAYGNQPGIAQWNLARFAETLLPLLAADEEAAIQRATEAVVEFQAVYRDVWLGRMRSKLGLTRSLADDEQLVNDLLSLLEAESVDFTRFFVALTDSVPVALAEGNEAGAKVLSEVVPTSAALDRWLSAWRSRSEAETSSPGSQETIMSGANPIYIPRNHLVEAALNLAVSEGNLSGIEELQSVLAQPFERRAGLDAFTAGAEPGAVHKTFCGT